MRTLLSQGASFGVCDSFSFRSRKPGKPWTGKPRGFHADLGRRRATGIVAEKNQWRCFSSFWGIVVVLHMTLLNPP